MRVHRGGEHVQGFAVNAVLVTSRGIAIIEVECPAPPRLEVWVPTPCTPEEAQDLGRIPSINAVGYVLRGAGQETWPVYEEPCKA